MAMKKIYNEMKSLKMAEVPGYVKPVMSFGFVKQTVTNSLEKYRVKYIETSSAEPLFHVLFGGLVFSYFVALPQERRHMEHAQHAKEHGGH